MNRSIKVSDVVYESLQQLQFPRETFSEVVERLVKLRNLISTARPMIEGAVRYWEEPIRAAAAASGKPLEGGELKGGSADAANPPG